MRLSHQHCCYGRARIPTPYTHSSSEDGTSKPYQALARTALCATEHKSTAGDDMACSDTIGGAGKGAKPENEATFIIWPSNNTIFSFMHKCLHSALRASRHAGEPLSASERSASEVKHLPFRAARGSRSFAQPDKTEVIWRRADQLSHQAR